MTTPLTPMSEGEIKDRVRKINPKYVNRIGTESNDLARLILAWIHQRAQLDEQQFYRWHHKEGRCGECFRKVTVEPDKRHTWTGEQWIAAVKTHVGWRD